MAERNEKKKDLTPLVAVSVIAVLFVSISLLTYFLINSKGRVPKMPIFTISLDRSNTAIAQLEKRIAGFAANEAEKKLISALEAVHIAETEVAEGRHSDVARLLSSLEERLAYYASEERDRYLLLGDFLALRFHRVISEKLKTGGRATSGSASVDASVRLSGGAFYKRAREKGVINGNGRTAVTPLLFPTLFRYRWRLLGGLTGNTGFSRDERNVLDDFMVRFSEPSQVERRLEAAARLERSVPDYNGVVAKGLILYQGGKLSEAVDFLNTAIASGRGETSIESFLKALR